MIVCDNCGHVFSAEDEHLALKCAAAQLYDLDGFPSGGNPPVDDIVCPECGEALDLCQAMEIVNDW